MPQKLGEYDERGDYHRRLDPNWPYLPVYLEKMARVESYLNSLPKTSRIIDMGCGEGVLVDAYRQKGYEITGVDLNYESQYVMKGSILNTGLPAASFDVALCLDVIEHINFADQVQAVAEMARLLPPGGKLLFSVPNLAHLASRLSLLVRGNLIRTSTIERHPGDRPYGEYQKLLAPHFTVKKVRGLFPTFPVISFLTIWKPSKFVWLHRVYNRTLAYPGWCFLTIFECTRR